MADHDTLPEDLASVGEAVRRSGLRTAGEALDTLGARVADLLAALARVTGERDEARARAHQLGNDLGAEQAARAAERDAWLDYARCADALDDARIEGDILADPSAAEAAAMDAHEAAEAAVLVFLPTGTRLIGSAREARRG